MQKSKFHKYLKRLFTSILILGTIGIIYVGWKTTDSYNKAALADKDDSLNSVVCGNGKGYKIGNYTGIKNKSDISFIEDVEFRYLCSNGVDINDASKQKIVDFIEGQDTNYFTTPGKLPKIYETNFGNWPIPNPTDIYIASPQLTNDQVEQAVISLNHKNYDNVTYQLINVPKQIELKKFDYSDTILVLLLFWFIVFVLWKVTFYLLVNSKLYEQLSRLKKLLRRYPLILPSFIVGISIVVVANNLHSSNSQELLTLNQKCHDLATKYVDDRKTEYNSSLFTNKANYSAPYTYDSLLESYTFNKQMNTCLAHYIIFKYANGLASPTPSPVPTNEVQSNYVDDVISGQTLGSFYYTECDNSNYCQKLVDWNLSLKSWGLNPIGFWQALFLQTFDRLSFVRNWMGL